MNKYSNVISILLMIVSIVSLPIAFSVSCSIGNVSVFGMAGMSYLWIMLLFCVIPIGCFVFGVCLYRKSKKGKKNIITGAITSIIMIVFGSYGFAVECDQSGDFLSEASITTNIYMPSHVRSMSYHSFDGRIGNAIILNDYEREAFERNIRDTHRWVKELPAASKGALPVLLPAQINDFNYFSLFVLPINEYNPTSFSSGKYSFTLVAYKYSAKQIFVFDQYEYVC